MRSPHRKSISLLMLIIFLVTSFGTYGFDSKWLAHELDHDRHAPASTIDHDHEPQLDTEGNPATEALSDAEHKLLHSAGHFQPLFISPILDGIGESPARVTPMPLRLLALPPAELEPPFRPPRTTFRI